MISNLGNFAHPKKKASGMAKRSIALTPVIGNQNSFPAPPKSKPDPVNKNIFDVGMVGAVPGKGGSPKGTFPSADLDTRSAGPGTASKPGAKKTPKGPVHKRAKALTPFFGSY